MAQHQPDPRLALGLVEYVGFVRDYCAFLEGGASPVECSLAVSDIACKYVRIRVELAL